MVSREEVTSPLAGSNPALPTTQAVTVKENHAQGYR